MKSIDLSWNSRFGRLLLVAFAGAVATTVLFAMAPWSASGAGEVHGIGFAKGCNSPTTVGAPYVCHFVILNNSDTAGDTLTINSIVDTVHPTAGDVVSANLLPSAVLTFTGLASCNVGQTLCTLLVGSMTS